MGTRGMCGFRVGNKNYITYNHFDSYPEWLGENVLNVIKKYLETDTDIEKARKIVEQIELVNDAEKVPQKWQQYYKFFANEGVSTGRLDEWYVLLREAQGDLGIYLRPDSFNSVKHMVDCSWAFEYNTWLEYGYIINLDTKKLDYYEAKKNKKGNYRLKKMKSISLSRIDKQDLDSSILTNE